ncbi:hypothetical protein IVB08_10200 [Bradyrhizobium sp. 173]|nr:hypothetical protein [Bradyrhizobium sp. 173]
MFNAAQVEGYALNPVPEPLGPVARIAGADAFVRATGARIEHGGDRAFYPLSTDSIQMPPEEMFCGTETLSRSEGYYATLVHELTRRETQARSHVRQNASAVRPTPPRNWSLKSARRSCARSFRSRRMCVPITLVSRAVAEADEGRIPARFRCRRQGIRKTRRKDIHFAAAPAIASSRTPEGTALELLQWFWQRGLQCRRLSP